MTAVRTSLLRIGFASTALVFLAGCQSTPTAPFSPDHVAINPDYQAGYVENLGGENLPSLQQMIDRTPTRSAAREGADLLRSPAIKDAALSYGAKGGLAWESKAINAMLQGKASEITRTYDFSRVLIEAPGHAKILPPVISKADETWETSDAGRSLRVADTYYEIIEQARFTPNAPLWQTYLLRTYSSPEAPNDLLLPTNREERAEWSRWVTEGWQMGRTQAQEIFKIDLARLERDFTGMVRYKELLEEGKVSPPTVSNAQMGTTGSGDDMRVNDRSVTITQDPRLNVGRPEEWRAPVTTPRTSGQPTGQDPSQPPAAPQIDASTAEVQAAVDAGRSSRSSDSGARRAW